MTRQTPIFFAVILMRLGTVAAITIGCATVLGALSLRMPHQFSRSDIDVLDASAPIPFFIQDGTGVPGYVAQDRELARWALEAWSRESGGKLKFTEAQGPESALVRLRWVSAREGLFGETQHVQVGGKEGALVFVMPEVGQLGEPLSARALHDPLLRDTIVYLTCVHELGHAVGLPHTRKFEDIMYSFAYGGDIVQYFMRYREKLQSRGDIRRLSGVSPSDTAVLRQLYK
jgi:matrixin